MDDEKIRTIVLGVVGVLGGWIAIAAVAGSTGGPTPFGVFSFLCGTALYLAGLGIQATTIIRNIVRRRTGTPKEPHDG